MPTEPRKSNQTKGASPFQKEVEPPRVAIIKLNKKRLEIENHWSDASTYPAKKGESCYQIMPLNPVKRLRP